MEAKERSLQSRPPKGRKNKSASVRILLLRPSRGEVFVCPRCDLAQTQKLRTRPYQINLSPSCIRRAVTRVLVIAPNVALCVFTLALPN